jgi:hypothetical protein
MLGTVPLLGPLPNRDSVEKFLLIYNAFAIAGLLSASV